MKQGFAGRAVRMTLLTGLCTLFFFAALIIVPKIISAVFSKTPEPGTQFLPGVVQGTKWEPKERAVQIVFVTGEEGGLMRCLMTVTDCVEQRFRLIVIPPDTRLELSDTLYSELSSVNESVNPSTTLSELFRCFERDTAYLYTGQALQEMLPVQADYLTEMPEALCEKLIKTNPDGYTYDAFVQEGLKDTIKEAGSMKAYLGSIWEQCKSTALTEDKMFYLETYEGLTNLSVSCTMIPGKQHNDGYVIDADYFFFY